MVDKNNLLMASIAHLYYRKSMSQDMIAKKLYISRSTVSRLLQKALESEIVQIHINFPNERNTKLEEKIKAKFKVNRCHVLVTEESTSFEQVCHYSASVIDELIEPNMTIGLSSGRTIYNVVGQLHGRSDYNLRFTQVKGNANIDTNYIFDSPESVRIAAKKYDAKFNLIFSPLYVFNSIARNYLLKDRMIVESLDVARECDLLIASVGHVTSNEISIYRDYIDVSMLESSDIEGHITSIMGHFLNLNGKIINQRLDESVIGLSLDELKSIENKVVIAHGKDKSKSVLSVLKAGLVDTLIVDEFACKDLF